MSERILFSSSLDLVKITIPDAFQKKLTPFLNNYFDKVQKFDNDYLVSSAEFIFNQRRFAHFFETHELLEYTDFSKDVLNMMSSIKTLRDDIQSKKVFLEKEVQQKITLNGFSSDRKLTEFQLKNLVKHVSLRGPADFSVPGAGKTTIALAYYCFNRAEAKKLLVISPINAFLSWEDELSDCLVGDNKLIRLRGSTPDILKKLNKNDDHFIINYDLLRQRPDVLKAVKEKLADENFTVILDESHRTKGQAISYCIRDISIYPKFKMILTGTPMTQSSDDLKTQFSFLYPSENIHNPDDLLDLFQNIFQRITKNDMADQLPPFKETKVVIPMTGTQQKIYKILKDDAKKYALDLKLNLEKFRHSVLRMIQFCSNPLSQAEHIRQFDANLADDLIEDGYGEKFEKLIQSAVELSKKEKIIIWSYFRKNIDALMYKLKFLNPVHVYGGMPAGSREEVGTREYSIHKFKTDPSCRVFIGNPAAAGESISLHKVCHKAYYLDRNFNAAQFLQSKDRIHRLGSPLDKNVEIFIFQYANTIDDKVNYRLEEKIKNLEDFLKDKSIIPDRGYSYDSLEVDGEETIVNTKESAVPTEDLENIADYLIND